jgi:hypothetical protein
VSLAQVFTEVYSSWITGVCPPKSSEAFIQSIDACICPGEIVIDFYSKSSIKFLSGSGTSNTGTIIYVDGLEYLS